MDLFLEENETISNISNNKSFSGDVNKYLLTQLFTAFSLLTRRVYLNGDKMNPGSEEEKGREFLKHLNSIKFDKNSKLTNQMLEYFNNNILRIEDIYQSNETKINNTEDNNNKNNLEQYDKKTIIEAFEIKRKATLDKNMNMNNFSPFDNINNGTVILNNDNKEEAVQQVDSISYEKNYRNIDLENEEYKREKSVNMRKILELDEEKLKNISIGEFQELISEVYENGELLNKEIEDKITGGKGKLFNKENSQDKKDIQNSFSIKISNEISMNTDEKNVDDEEVIDDRDLDFEQEEIKNDNNNKNSFFEKGEGFSKDFFPNNSEDDDDNDKISKKQMETISHKENIDLSKSNQSKSSFSN